MKNIIREMYQDTYTEAQIQFLESHTYKGKTANEWLREASNAKGYDENGNPAWYKYQALAEDCITIAKLKLMGQCPKKGNNKSKIEVIDDTIPNVLQERMIEEEHFLERFKNSAGIPFHRLDNKND